MGEGCDDTWWMFFSAPADKEFLTGSHIPKTSTKDPEFDSSIFYYPNVTWINVNLIGILVFVLFDSILKHDYISAGW